MEEIAYPDEEQENLGGDSEEVTRTEDLNMTSAKGLKLPSYVGGDLDLRGRTTAEGLTLPPYVEGDPGEVTKTEDLNITSAAGLKLPPYVGEEPEKETKTEDLVSPGR